MKLKWMSLLIIVTLLAGSLSCSFSVDLGLGGTSTSTPLPATATQPAATPLPPATATSTAIPVAPSATAAPTLAPSPTPLPPPEVITLQNYNQLVFKRAYGVGALVKARVSPDGKNLLLAYSTTLIMLQMSDLSLVWKTDSLKFLQDITFSKDGSQLISVSIGGAVQVWDAASGTLISTPFPQKEGVSHIALSPSGALLAVTDYTGITTVWNIAEGRQVMSNNGQAYPGGILGLVISPDDSTLIIEGIDSARAKQVQQWKIENGAFKIGLPGLSSQVTSLQFSPDGKKLYGIDYRDLAAGPTTDLFAWDAASGKVAKAFPKGNLITAYLPSPDGKTLLAATRDNLVRLLDAETGAELGRFAAHKTALDALAFSPDGQKVVSVSVDGELKIWETAAQKVIKEGGGIPGLPYEEIAFSKGGSLVLFLSPTRKNVGVVDTSTWEVVKVLGSGETELSALAISAQGSLAAARDSENRIHIWNVGTGEELRQIESGALQPIRKLKFSPDEKSLTSLSTGQVLIWDTASGLKQKDLTGYRDFAYAPSGKQMVTDSVDYALYLTDPQTGKRIAGLPADYINALAYSPDSSTIAVGGRKVQSKEKGLDNLIYLVDALKPERLPVEMRDLPGLVTNLAYSPAGDLIASSDDQGNISLWNPLDGSRLMNFEEAACPPASLEFSQDGTLLYVGGGDGTVAILSTTPIPGTQNAPANSASPAGGETVLPEISSKPYQHAKGLLSINLPAGWETQEIKDLTLNVSAPDNAAVIVFTAVNTLGPMTGEFFSSIISAYEQGYSLYSTDYKGVDKSLDPENGQAFVSKSVKLNGVDFFWETYYTRDEAAFYQLNFITRADLANTLLPLYQQIYASMKVNKDYILKQIPYSVTRTYNDPGGSFSYEFPTSWLQEDITNNDNPAVSITGRVHVAPDASMNMSSLVVSVNTGDQFDEAKLETTMTAMLTGEAEDARVTRKEKLPNGDLKMTFEMPSKNFKGVNLGSNFGGKIHVLSIKYSASLEKEYAALVEFLINACKKL